MKDQTVNELEKLSATMKASEQLAYWARCIDSILIQDAATTDTSMNKAQDITAAAMRAVDKIMADIKKRGRGMQFMNKVAVEGMRQEWISMVVRELYK